MLLVISPAKALDFESKASTKKFTQSDFLDDSQVLVNVAKRFNALDIMEMMGVSQKIADLNVERFNAWQQPFDLDNAKQALFAFNGDVYSGLDAQTLTATDLTYAQKHLRILSGLYGLLRPLDLMQAYRLEMGKKITTERGTNLYHFWGEQITEALNKQLKTTKSEHLINLASTEYFKSVKPKLLDAEIITPAFKDYKNGDYKMISFFAKKARGLLSRYIIENKLTNVEDIKNFDVAGYSFSPEFTAQNKDPNTWTFIRKQ